MISERDMEGERERGRESKGGVDVATTAPQAKEERGLSRESRSTDVHFIVSYHFYDSALPWSSPPLQSMEM